MRSPRGFGKNYFTLSAIQAYASAKRLEQNASRIRIHRENRLQISEEASEIDDPPPELLTPIEPLPSQGGLCNCKFARLAHLCLRRNRKPKKLILSPIHTYSTVSPPSWALISSSLMTMNQGHLCTNTLFHSLPQQR